MPESPPVHPTVSSEAHISFLKVVLASLVYLDSGLNTTLLKLLSVVLVGGKASEPSPAII